MISPIVLDARNPGREQQVIAALEQGRGTVREIVESIYDDLEPSLTVAAQGNVRAHLDKLKAEGRAAVDDRD